MDNSGINVGDYQRSMKMLEEAAKKSESIRLFDEEVKVIHKTTEALINAWITMKSTGSKPAVWTDEPKRFADLYNRFRKDDMVALDSRDTEFFVKSIHAIADSISVAKYGFTTAQMQEMAKKMMGQGEPDDSGEF